MNIRMEEMPQAVARYLSYKLSIRGASEKTVYEYSLDLYNFFRYVFFKDASKEERVDLSVLTDEQIGSVPSQKIY